MASQPTRSQNYSYYTPYLPSDEELSDADSDDSFIESIISSRSSMVRPENAGPDLQLPDELPDFAALAKNLANPAPASGPSFVNVEQQDFYGKNRLSKDVQYSSYTSDFDISGTTINMKKISVPSIVVLQSRDRDRVVYPQPTQCELFLPRTYKKVSSFSITQLNLVSAFLYFRQAKENLAIQILENGRIFYDSIFQTGTIKSTTARLDPSSNLIPLKLTNSIREGSYSISSLLNELQTQLNKTPLFYDFQNGFSDFQSKFRVNGDFSLNFNLPGDTYYDALNKTFITNPTKAQIVSYYFQTQFAGKTAYTDDEVYIAYYYPVLKEVILDPDTDKTQYNFDISSTNLTSLLADQTVEEYLLYSFTGINDPIALTVIKQNQPLLDLYRINHTFRYSLINRYICSYDPTNNRVTIQTSSLNTSLVNLLNTQYNTILQTELVKYNLTVAQYQAIATSNAVLAAILTDMYALLQNSFADAFAVDYQTYSRDYYATLSNYALLRNGLNTSNTIKSYDQAITTTSSNIIDDLRKEPFVYWSNMTNLGDVLGNSFNMGSSQSNYPDSSNFAYNLVTSNADLNQHFIDVSGLIYTDNRRSAGDILIDVEPGKYTVFKFKSEVRQTLQVETLPRQIPFRYPYYNQTNPLAIYPIGGNNPIYQEGYSFVDPTSYSYLTGKATYSDCLPTFLTNYSNTSSSQYGLSNSTTTSSLGPSNSNGVYYTFITPTIPTALQTSGAVDYKYKFNINFETLTTFPTKCLAFLYHDQAAFNADFKNKRNENVFFYKQVLDIPEGLNKVTMTFNTYTNQQYYLIIRPVISSPPTINFTITPWMYSTAQDSSNNLIFMRQLGYGEFDPLNPVISDDVSGNYTVATNIDPDWIRLPITSNLFGNDPSDEKANFNIPTDIAVIGYDISGISNDLTDYAPFSSLPNSTFPLLPDLSSTQIRYDPLTKYGFQFNSPYDISGQTYFPEGNINAIYTPSFKDVYEWKPLNPDSKRQFKILNWYGTNYIQNPLTVNTGFTENDITTSIVPYAKSTTNNQGILGYQYKTSGDVLSLGAGVCGFTFLPSGGIWELDRITFKSNFTNATNDPNLPEKPFGIQALGVFVTSQITSFTLDKANLSSAIAILLFTTSTNTTSDPAGGTYYTFTHELSLITSKQATQFTGFTQRGKQLITDPNSFYSIIPFTNLDYSLIQSGNYSSLDLTNAKVTTIENLVGSPIPYPYAYTPIASPTFYDGNTPPVNANVQYGVVVSQSNANTATSLYNYPSGFDESTSKYQLSIPCVNSHLHWLKPQSFIDNSGAFYQDWSGVSVPPSFIEASIPNYILLQGNNFSIMSYNSFTQNIALQNTSRDLTLIYSFTNDDIFMDYEYTYLLTTSGTSLTYNFVGTRQVSGGFELIFKQMNPRTGVLERYYPLGKSDPSYFTISTALSMFPYQVQHYVTHNNGSWFMTAYDTNTNGIRFLGVTPGYTGLIEKYFSGMDSSEIAMDPSGATVNIATWDSGTSLGFSNFIRYSLNEAEPNNTWIGYSSPYEITIRPTGQDSVTGYFYPDTYNQIMITLNSETEEMFFTTLENDDGLPVGGIKQNQRFYGLNNFTRDSLYSIYQSNAVLDFSQQIFQTTHLPNRLYGGGAGTKWATFNTAPLLAGNRNDAIDSPITIGTAHQIFYPTCKIELRKIKNTDTAITDLTDISSAEYPHTCMFSYSNLTSLFADISSNGGQWGKEKKSNFLTSDISFNGYYFNSYLMNIPMYPNINSSDSYYLAVRGYCPTERFQTLLRFYLPNRYDFGYLTFFDLSSEIQLTSNASIDFNPDYKFALTYFNSNFVFTNKNFGQDANLNFTGSNISSSNFGQFIGLYSNLNKQYQSNAGTLSNINSNLTANMSNFIVNNLRYILPSNAYYRTRFTDPIPFKIFWKSQLTPNFETLDEEWGLGYNLGYPKKDTGFSTSQLAATFYKIQQEFIYLRLSPEFDLNKIDAGGKEKLSAGRSATGTINQYYLKLLLSNFGDNATTFIHNPINLTNPIDITKMTFSWTFPNGTVIDNDDAEWDMTINLNETYEIPVTPFSELPPPVSIMKLKTTKVTDPKLKLPASIPSTLLG